MEGAVLLLIVIQGEPSHCSICCGAACLPQVSQTRRDWFGRTSARDVLQAYVLM